ncbi:MAG TPA: hypothetical protein VL171_17300 [Verrucomicrobiae bacterium]|nr:hypothetical protein [Verrucomicrobiae bacterium]
MNAHLPRVVTSVWFLLDVVVPLVVATWVLLDVKYLQLWSQRKIRLKLAGKWDELDAHFQRRLKTRRPLAYFFQNYIVPGNVEASYALYLYERGLSEAALEMADLSIARARKQPALLTITFGPPAQKTLHSALHTRVLILNGLGRYDDARATSAELRTLAKVSNKTHATASFTELYSGRLDEALELAYETLSHDPKDGSARLIASAVYCLKGAFTEAINVLVHELKDVTELYSPKDLSDMLKDRESAKFIALQRQYAATIHQPVRLLSIARVYIEQQNFDDATRALDATEPLLGNNPIIRCSYNRSRAICAAAKGDAKQTEQYLAEARTITLSQPKRDTRWETNIAAGRCYLSLQLIDKARAEFLEAQRRALHPIEKHVTNYWLACTAVTAKRRNKAIRYYQTVVADGIPTVMRQESLAALVDLK